MASFEWKKILKTLSIITATTSGIFNVLKTAGLKPPKAFLDAIDIMRLAGGIVGGFLVKDYAVYKK